MVILRRFRIINLANKIRVENKTYPCNPLGWFPERQSFPHMVINRLGQQIRNVFLTAGAVDRADVLFGEHARFFVWTVLLLGDEHVVEVFDL